jgi:tetratricopeptide (TPR) repeat protein
MEKISNYLKNIFKRRFLSKKEAEDIERLRQEIINSKLSDSKIAESISHFIKALKEFYDSRLSSKKKEIKQAIQGNFEKGYIQFFLNDFTPEEIEGGKNELKKFLLTKKTVERFKKGKNINSRSKEAFCFFLGHGGFKNYIKTQNPLSIQQIFRLLENDSKFELYTTTFEKKKKVSVSKVQENERNIFSKKNWINRVPALLIVISILCLLGISIFHSSILSEIINNKNTRTAQIDSITYDHQKNIGNLFSKDSTKFRLLILPFKSIKNCSIEKSNYEYEILERFDSIIKRDRLHIEVQYYSKLRYKKDAVYDYSSLLNQYNLDMVLWGGFEERCGDSTSIYIKYTHNPYRFYTKNSMPIGISKDSIKRNYVEEHSGMRNLKLVSDLKNGDIQGGINNIIFWSLSKYYFKKQQYKKSLKTIEKVLDSNNIRPLHYTMALLNTYSLKDSILSLKYAKVIAGGRLSAHLKKKLSFKELISHKELKIPTIYEKFAWHIIASDFAKQKKYATCLKIYSSIIKYHQEDNATWFQLGKTQSLLGKNKEAIASFQNAIKKGYKRLDKVWLELAVVYGHLGWSVKEKEAYKKVLKINPKNYRAWLNVAILFTRKKETDKSLKAIHKALEINPNYAEGWYHKAVNLGVLLKNEEALYSINKAIEINSLSGKYFSLKGTILASTGRLEEAQTYIDRSLQLDSTNVQGWLSKSAMMLTLKNKKEAIKAYNKAIELKPELKKRKEMFINAKGMKSYVESYFKN